MKIRRLPRKDEVVVDVRFVMTKIELNDLSSELVSLVSDDYHKYVPTVCKIATGVANAAHNNLSEWSKEDE